MAAKKAPLPIGRTIDRHAFRAKVQENPANALEMVAIVLSHGTGKASLAAARIARALAEAVRADDARALEGTGGPDAWARHYGENRGSTWGSEDARKDRIDAVKRLLGCVKTWAPALLSDDTEAAKKAIDEASWRLALLLDLDSRAWGGRPSGDADAISASVAGALKKARATRLGSDIGNVEVFAKAALRGWGLSAAAVTNAFRKV